MKLEWGKDDIPRSTEYGDIYFSAEGGLEETAHVFLRGNGLPDAWQGRADFTICETGFGTGLNFLSVWRLFEETAQPGQNLNYISFEKFPLSADDIWRALGRWNDVFGQSLERMLEAYPLRVPGFHRAQVTQNICLTLIFGDVNALIPQLDTTVDAWFLDGFAPSKNPDMWSDVLFEHMGRLSRSGASVATFSAAGVVKRGLVKAGFDVSKTAGFGRKRDMLTGKKPGQLTVQKGQKKKIAVIGAGLAGASMAYVLRGRGMNVDVYDPNGIASGASGNPLGLINPKLTAQQSPETDFYASAYALTLRVLKGLYQTHPGIAFRQCGAFHPAMDNEKQKRQSAYLKNLWWHSDHMHPVTRSMTEEITGVPLGYDGIFFPDAACVNPRALCTAYLDGAPVERLGVTGIEHTDGHWVLTADDGSRKEGYDSVVLANGWKVKDFAQTAWLPIHTTAGQISVFEPTERTRALRCNLHFGGYLSPARDGIQLLGATFKPWDDEAEVTQDDHAENLQKLATLDAALAQGIDITDGRASLRTSSQDRLPVIGQVPDAQQWQDAQSYHGGLYVSTAHGSHGIISSLMAAYDLAAQICGDANAMSLASRQSVAPERFLGRALKKNRLAELIS